MSQFAFGGQEKQCLKMVFLGCWQNFPTLGHFWERSTWDAATLILEKVCTTVRTSLFTYGSGKVGLMLKSLKCSFFGLCKNEGVGSSLDINLIFDCFSNAAHSMWTKCTPKFTRWPILRLYPLSSLQPVLPGPHHLVKEETAALGLGPALLSHYHPPKWKRPPCPEGMSLHNSLWDQSHNHSYRHRQKISPQPVHQVWSLVIFSLLFKKV